jgi:DNA-binding LacI/PurR family transcriptional regulator
MSYTMKDIAALACVSSTPVSRVINASEIVSYETRTRIRSVISTVHYSPDVSAAELRRARSGILKKNGRDPQILAPSEPNIPFRAEGH